MKSGRLPTYSSSPTVSFTESMQDGGSAKTGSRLLIAGMASTLHSFSKRSTGRATCAHSAIGRKSVTDVSFSRTMHPSLRRNFSRSASWRSNGTQRVSPRATIRLQMKWSNMPARAKKPMKFLISQIIRHLTIA